MINLIILYKIQTSFLWRQKSPEAIQSSVALEVFQKIRIQKQALFRNSRWLPTLECKRTSTCTILFRRYYYISPGVILLC